LVKYTISETDDYDRLVEMFIRHDLEFSFDEPLPTNLVKCWKAEDEKGRLISGCVLAMRGGEYIIDGISTEPEYRKEKIGGKLLKLALDEAKARGGKEVYLVAKAPGFFKKHDFKEIEATSVPDLFDCLSCPQYRKTCFPEVMKLIM
jgi:amino-acid N-acetyltransferase